MSSSLAGVGAVLAAGIDSGLQLDPTGDLTLILNVPSNVAREIVKEDVDRVLLSFMAHHPDEDTKLGVRVSALYMYRASALIRDALRNITLSHRNDTLITNKQMNKVIVYRRPRATDTLFMLAALYRKPSLIPVAMSPRLLFEVALQAKAHKFNHEYVMPLLPLQPLLSMAMRANPLPREITLTLDAWLLMTAYIHYPFGYSDVTLTYIMEATDKIVRTPLLNNDHLIAQLNARRLYWLTLIIDGLHDLHASIVRTGCLSEQEQDPVRKRFCNMSVVTALITHMRSLRLIYPKPRPPFHGLSVRQLTTFVSERSSVIRRKHPNCYLGFRLRREFHPIIIRGLKLDDLRIG
ncbi:hypothetical protein BJX64DRAFT_286012 [Aspergillus heterothallicus]